MTDEDHRPTWTRIMFNLFKYIFSLSNETGSEEILIIKLTIYFLIPKQKNAIYKDELNIRWNQVTKSTFTLITG